MHYLRNTSCNAVIKLTGEKHMKDAFIEASWFFSSPFSVCESHRHFFQVRTREVFEVSKTFRGKGKHFLLISAWMLGGVWHFLQNWEETGSVFIACQAGLKTCLISFPPNSSGSCWRTNGELRARTHFHGSSTSGLSPVLSGGLAEVADVALYGMIPG